ncbi:Smr/MutS family protein [Puniceibacterium sp. IMCC21224]|uniref:Smr/MutS family protein n=1 Tax=Puniceibacterium sp. IMCC21224 TaxID=1618204 RepID=UPI00064DB6A7|nr:Smr/MutS family protein [Puniceibacterium sp. IMCC21224]KMK65401.1 hypothetical protein IMCC21224_11232 [Puniceibacterium sp. IMCC21224]
MTRRRLRQDELDLWRQVARSAEPFGQRDRFAPLGPKAIKPKANPEPAEVPTLPRFEIGQKTPNRSETRALPQTSGQRLAAEKVAMDKKAHTRLKRGKLTPEGRIDLHGMTLDQAHPALIRFVLMSQTRGLRLVLIITGKGQREDPYDPAPRRRGVLKQQVPMWLRMPPVAQAVLQIEEAHIRHGGGGAYYIYLRRTR